MSENKHGGVRPNSGRKTGTLNTETKMRNKALRSYRERVIGVTDKLLNAQLANAFGNTFLMKIVEKKTYNDNGKVVGTKKVHEIVESSYEIQQFFEEHEDGEPGEMEGDYYYMTTKKPDNKALAAILDRTYGKPKQAIVTEDENGKTLPLQQVMDSVAKVVGI